MSDFFTPESIRTHTGGTFLARAEHTRECHGVSIDTRELSPGQLFVALPGERTDGHDHLQKAADAGATIALVERDVEAPAGMTLIKVHNCRAALARLATAYRATLRSTRVVGVTGSNGKTTTVRLLAHVLGSALRGSASRKSFNNELGLPLTILNARPTDQYLVCEIGMSSPGEIRRLAAIARPDVGVITSIGKAHLEAFGTVAGIAKEKASLLLEIAESGVGIVTAESDALEHALPPGVSVIRFGERSTADLRLTLIDPSRDRVRFQINDRARFEVPLVGKHNAWNAAAAVAVARRLGLSDEQIAESLRTAAGAAMRLDRRTFAGIEVVNAAYNANPDSMLAALRTFAGLAAGAERRVVVLGDMLELGEASTREHRVIGDALASSIEVGKGPDVVVLVGLAMAEAAGPLRNLLPANALWLESEAGDGRSIAERLAPGDAVLLKGSRAMGLERVVLALESAQAATGT